MIDPNSPDILLLMSDQHRGDGLSCEGNPSAFTPNLDALAASGTRFTRAYSTCPSCIAQRRALLTGMFPAHNGLVGYREGLPIRSVTLPRVLRDAGYQTALIGRAMHQSPVSARYGYEHVELAFTLSGNDHYLRDFRRAHPGLQDIRALGLSFNGWTSRPWPWEEELHPTSWVGNKAVEFLEFSDETRPLFLTASFYAPHPPLLPPRDCYEEALARAAKSPRIGSWARRPEPADAIDAYGQILDGRNYQVAQAGYYGLIAHLDAIIGNILFQFRRLRKKCRRPLLIVYTSDHGEMLGDHYLLRKTAPYEGSSRIPLLVAAGPALPGFANGQIVDRPVCLEDLFPTFCAAADIEPPLDLDGENLLPVLRGDRQPAREWLHSEHSAHGKDVGGMHFLTDGIQKYIWFPASGHEQLFDLAADPWELEDLALNPSAEPQVAIWRERLVLQLCGRPEGFVQDGKLTPGCSYRATIPGGLADSVNLPRMG